MLIELKGSNYYSKVFKRGNYKLWNSTFWVVIIMSGVCPLAPWQLVARRPWGQDLDPQHIVFLPESPCFLEQGLHLSLAFLLSSFHAFTSIKIIFITHGWWTAPWGCGHLRKSLSHRRRQCWCRVPLEVLYLPDVDAQSTKRDASFYSPTKDVRTSCPNTPSEALVRLTII